MAPPRPGPDLPGLTAKLRLWLRAAMIWINEGPRKAINEKVLKKIPGSFFRRTKLNLQPFEDPIHGALRYLFPFEANQVEPMKATVVGLITPHVLKIADLAKRAETGANVDWHVRDAVAKTIDDLGLQYNARELLSAYIQWLETAANEAGQARQVYGSVLRAAQAAAARHLRERD